MRDFDSIQEYADIGVDKVILGSAAIKDENFDLILSGLQSDDTGMGQVGVLVGELLNMSVATLAIKTDIDKEKIRVKRELESGWFQWVTLGSSASITIQSGINQPRYPSLKGIMGAKKKDIKVAQILLSHDDLGNRRRYLNAKHTIEALLECNVIPIINENDSVTVEEIKIGDNDTLSATVACLVDAQLLIILSDVEGLYNRDPSSKIKGEKAELVSHVGRVNEEIERTAGKSNNRLTVGGMYTKVLAAKKTMSFGIPTLVVNGLDEKILENVFSGKDVGTLFWSGKGKIRDRKHWIAHTLKPSGVLIVDEGARKALVEMGKSLLPAGLKKIQGEFEFGKAVKILDEEGKEIGRGLVNYNSRDLQQIKGVKTSAIKKSIGDSFYEEVIHRDDLVIF